LGWGGTEGKEEGESVPGDLADEVLGCGEGGLVGLVGFIVGRWVRFVVEEKALGIYYQRSSVVCETPCAVCG
jgi:hypothetical protein